VLSLCEEVQAGNTRYLGAYPGTVIDNADPEGLHRVRIRIEGLVDPSAWAFPITMGGGSPQRGGHIVPAVGADVVVWFMGGDVEWPIYAGGWWGKPDAGDESPERVREVGGADAAKVQSIELEDVRISVDEREGKRALSIENKITGDFVTLDFKAGGMHVKMTSAILLQCVGAIDLDATQITLNGRLVLPDTKGI
jgi:hypothetical protein